MVSNDEREELGEALYREIMKINPDTAAKLTGMMLDSQTARQIREALKDASLLKKELVEAMKCLEDDVDVDWKTRATELQDELKEAEEWAGDVQKELDAWSEKEQRWNDEKEALSKEKVELTRRLSRLEASAEDSKKSSDKVGDLVKKAEAAAKQLSDVEKQNVKLEEDLRKCKERANELEDSLQKAQSSATSTSKPDANSEENKSSDEVSMADRMKADMLAKCKALLCAKDEENARLKAEIKQASSTVNGSSNGIHKNGSDHTALERKLQEAEASVKTNVERAAEAERRAKQAEEELEAARKADRATQAKADKSRELQQDLEQANREIKSFKAQNSKAHQEITELKKQMNGAGLITEPPKAAEPRKKETPKQKETQVVAQPPETIASKVEEVEEHEEIEEEGDDVPEPVVEEMSSRKQVFRGTQSAPAPNKVQATAAAKSIGKKKGGAVPAPSPGVKTKKKSSFQCSGTHVVAGCLALVVMIQAGLFVYESLYGESLR